MSKAPSVKSKESATVDPEAAFDSLVDSPPQENLDRIRNILFGAQSRDYEQRLQKLEQRIGSEAAALRGEIEKRFDSLDNLVRKQMELIQEKLRSEHGERREGVTKLGDAIDTLGKSSERRSRQIEELVARVQRELRQELIEQVSSVSEELEKRHADIGKQIERETQALRAAKLDRAGLAHLLSDLVTRIAD